MAASTQVTLSQMVDLALNSPEIGTVNFSILHTLLHVIVSQLELGECSVEFRGNDSQKVQNFISSTRPGPKLNLTEYSVGPGGKGPRKRVKRRRSGLEEKGKVDEKQSEKDPNATSSVQSIQTVVVVESGSKDSTTPAHYGVAVTKETFDKVQEEIRQLQTDMRALKDLPTNTGLIEEIRKSRIEKSGSSPMLDMFQILNLVKRMDATEITLQKLFTMVEEIAASPGGVIAKSSAEKDVDSDMKHQVIDYSNSDLEERVKDLELKMATLGGGDVEGGGGSVSSNIANGFATLQTEIVEFANQFCKADYEQLLKDVEVLKEKMKGGNNEELTPEVRLMQVEVKFNDCLEQINTLDTAFSEQIQKLQDRLMSLEGEIGGVLEKINLGLPAGDAAATGEQSVSELYHQLVNLQEEMGALAETATLLLGEKETNENTLNVVKEQIELLKTIKANKEDLDDALADKADACIINRKVSFSQFDAACDDLSKGIEDALAKLGEQETLWMQTLENIQKEVGSKIDKNELAPLQDFVNNKLKALQSKMRTLAGMKGDQEAAGTKSKYLKDVNCISCDKDVVMKKEMDSTLMPRPYSMPPGRNMGPYLAYELDQLRKQQKCLPNSRNMNMLEAAVQSGGKGKRGRNHLCNRYCGGSHTVTTPQQRVTRMGHFLEQWGPEIAPLKETIIKGTDGHTYRGNADPAFAVLKQEPPSAPSVPLAVIEEVKSMEKQSASGMPERPASETDRPKSSIVSKNGSLTAHKGSKVSLPKSGSLLMQKKRSSAEKVVKIPSKTSLKETVIEHVEPNGDWIQSVTVEGFIEYPEKSPAPVEEGPPNVEEPAPEVSAETVPAEVPPPATEPQTE